MSETKTERLPIDARCVLFDETDYYGIDDEDKPFIGSINGIYLYDKNERTHCCEWTPSYWLIHLYDVIDFKGDPSDDKRDELSQKYEYNGGDDIYVHCHTLDETEKRQKKKRKCRRTLIEIGKTGVNYADVDHDEQMDSLREHYCGNCPF